MKNFSRFWPEILLLSAAALLLGVLFAGCQRLSPGQEVAVKTATGAAGVAVGLPPWVGQAAGTLIIALVAAVAGHKHGRRKERASKAV
jgi:membrane protein implicated in regulation of membrane protease activity